MNAEMVDSITVLVIAVGVIFAICLMIWRS